MSGIITLTAVVSGFIGVGIGYWLGMRSRALKIMETFLKNEGGEQT